MGQGAESPEASIGTRGSSRNVAVAGWPEPQARTEPAPEDSASDVSEPEDDKPDNEPGPDSMFSPKKQRGENGRAVRPHLGLYLIAEAAYAMDAHRHFLLLFPNGSAQHAQCQLVASSQRGTS